MRLQLTDVSGRPGLFVEATEIPQLPGFAVHNTMKSKGEGPPFIDPKTWTVSHIGTGCSIRGWQFASPDAAIRSSIAYLEKKGAGSLRAAVANAKRNISRARKEGRV